MKRLERTKRNRKKQGSGAGLRPSRKGKSRSAKKRSGANVIPDAELYRPLKKPITLRIDADVLAWFKKDGRRYQTRINGALRKVMEREMKGT